MATPVRLKNGSEEAKELCVAILLSLRHLMKDKPFVFFDLVMKARDPKYAISRDSIIVLNGLSLINENGSFHDSTKNIILSAVKGEGGEMTIVNPIKGM